MDIIQALGCATLRLDAAGMLVELDGAWEPLTGRTAAACLGRPLAALTRPAHQQELSRRLQHARARDGEWIVELTLEDPAGRPRRLRLHGTGVADGGLVGLLSAAPADGHAGVEQLLLRVAPTTRDAILITEADPVALPGPRIVYVNDAFCEQTGYAADEVVGRTPRLLQGPGTSRAALDRIRHALERWEPVRQEVLNYRKDGTTFWAELSITPVADDTGWFTHWVAVQRDVTDRKRVEHALAESEGRFRTLVDNLPGLVYRCSYDAAWRTEYMSDGFEALTGYPTAALDDEALSFRHLVHPDDLPVVRAAVRRAFAQQTAYDVEYRLRHRDGSYRWVSDQGRVQRRGDRYSLDGVMFDVTERHARDARLRVLEAAVRDATESVLITDADLDAPGPRITYANPGFERMTGYTAAEVVGRTPRLMQGPETDQALMAHLRRQLTNGEDFFGETINYRKDGTPFCIEWSISAVRDEDDRVTHYVAVQRDVTERRKAERQMRLLQQAIESAQDAVLVTRVSGSYADGDARRAVTYVNDAFEALTGYVDADLHDLDPFVLFGPETDAHVPDRLRAAREQRTAVTLETRLHRKDGAPFWTEFTTAPVLERDGSASYWVTVLRDISDSKRVEAEQAAREKAEEMVRFKDAILGNMSHEIRTPLTAIIGFADILRGELDDAQREFAELIADGGRRLLETLDAVLSLAQLEGNQVRRAPRPVPLAHAAHEAVAALRDAARRKDLHLHVRPSAGDAVCRVDPAHLRRILHDVVGNAVKFTEAGEVWVEVDVQDGRGRLRVGDTGVGIPPHALGDVFEPFKQASEGSTRSHEGAGLGLAIVKRLVDLNGGEVTIESEEGVGTVVTLRWPLITAPALVG